MIGRLRRRFVRIVMESFCVVLILILVGVNLVNRYNVYAGIDARLTYIAQSDMGPPAGMVASTPAEIQRWMEQNSAGVMSESSYFIFSGFMTGPILDHQLELLSAAVGEDGSALVARLLAGARDRGTVGSYRYYIPSRDIPYRLVFLRCENEFAALRSLLRTSLLVGLVSLALALIAATILSGRAVQPFARNMENQKRFISNASHELKTPLGVLISDLDLQVLESGETEWLRNAQVQADHLALLIRDLTTCSLLDEKTQREEAVPVDLSALGEAAAGELRPLALSRDLTLTADIQPGVTARGSADAFRTLLSVLMENAVKYTPAGGAIRLSVRRERRAVIQVVNDVEDLAEIDLSHVFERFYRGPGPRASEEGHGLGLSIARRITELYGGSIRAAAEGDRTVVFTVEL